MKIKPMNIDSIEPLTPKITSLSNIVEQQEKTIHAKDREIHFLKEQLKLVKHNQFSKKKWNGA